MVFYVLNKLYKKKDKKVVRMEYFQRTFSICIVLFMQCLLLQNGVLHKIPKFSEAVKNANRFVGPSLKENC